MTYNNRARLATALSGDVLEVGPGFQPFATEPGARVTFVTRPLPGGRDANFPELVGMPDGPAIDLERDLDVDGLAGIGDGSFDGVVVCHVVEHLVNPVAGLIELMRVLRPGGRLVIVLPERTMTRDHRREPTPLAHVLEEYDAGVTVLSEEHIREFVAKFGPPPGDGSEFEPPEPPDAEQIELHRRRSIHVHCWTGPEFAALIAGLLALGLVDCELIDLYLGEEDPGAEFGLVLQRPSRPSANPVHAAERFIESWCELVLSDPDRDPFALAAFDAALQRDAGHLVPGAVRRLGDRLPALLAERTAALSSEVRRLRLDLQRQAERLKVAEHRRDALERSRAYRTGRLLATPMRLLRADGRGSARTLSTGTSPEQAVPVAAMPGD